jgi:hypothetical protein
LYFLFPRDRPHPNRFAKGNTQDGPQPRGGSHSWIAIDRWRMYEAQDGTYTVDAEIAPFGEFVVQETLVLTRDFRLRNFRSNARSGNISCDFRSTPVRCDVLSKKSNLRSSASREQATPYNFIPFAGPIPFDLAWFVQVSVAQADRTVGRKTSVPVLSLQDDASNKGIELGIAETEEIEYLGQEKIRLLGREVLAHKFRTDDVDHPGPQNADLVWVSYSGIVLQISTSEEDTSIFLTEYKGPLL